ncbi:hypothetical protein JXB31_01660 [Candidatus Woesearchaeota archaeon]|nr:hypothetical protein [Candidatus Woesearchaeota archaeon]
MIMIGNTQGYDLLWCVPLSLLLVYWIFRYYKGSRKKKESFDDYYNKVLNSDKYKVRGKFEAD